MFFFVKDKDIRCANFLVGLFQIYISVLFVFFTQALSYWKKETGGHFDIFYHVLCGIE